MAHRVGMPRFLPLSLSLSLVPFFFFPSLFALYPSLSLSVSTSFSLTRGNTFSTLFFFSPFQWSFMGPPRPANDTLRFLVAPQVGTEHEYEISEAPSILLFHFLPNTSAFFRCLSASRVEPSGCWRIIWTITRSEREADFRRIISPLAGLV